MRAEIAIGAELDILTPAELHAALRELTQGALKTLPTPRRLYGSVTQPAAGVGIVDLGAPPPNRLWELRCAVITGADPTTVLAGSFVMFVSGLVPINGTLAVNLPYEFLQDRSATIPNVSPWSSLQCPIWAPDHLWGAFSGVLAGSSLSFAATVLEYPEGVTPDVVRKV